MAGIEIRGGGSSVAVMLSVRYGYRGEKALVGVGRTLETRKLDCETAGIAIDQRGGIVVDENLRTSQPHILAAGDVTGRMLLAHAASYMGEFAGRQRRRYCRFSRSRTTPYRGRRSPRRRWRRSECPWKLPSVRGWPASTASVPLMDNVKARIDRTTEGFFKIVAETGRAESSAGRSSGRMPRT